MDEGHAVDLIYVNFVEAFESVNHRILLAKLKSFGIDGNWLQWMKLYLFGWSYQVQIGGVLPREALA